MITLYCYSHDLCKGAANNLLQIVGRSQMDRGDRHERFHRMLSVRYNGPQYWATE